MQGKSESKKECRKTGGAERQELHQQVRRTRGREKQELKFYTFSQNLKEALVLLHTEYLLPIFH